MKFWVGVTNPAWFRFHEQTQSPEVNFWQPSARSARAGDPGGMFFLFKLKAPYNAIVGGGRWVSTQTFPLGVAWELFGQANGATTPTSFARLLTGAADPVALRREITCQILTDVFYLPQHAWVKQPASFAANIVVGKTYDDAQAEGLELLRAVLGAVPRDGPELVVDGEQRKWGEPILTRPRLHQGGFRAQLFDAYGRRCALTGENTLPALDAAHIVPFANASGTHEVSNGLLLRADFHRLFDNGLVTVEPTASADDAAYRIRVSPRISELWFNGKAYYRLDGQPLATVPERAEWRPDPDKLRWHNREVFQAA
jgi:putative restriction endonuclease